MQSLQPKHATKRKERVSWGGLSAPLYEKESYTLALCAHIQYAHASTLISQYKVRTWGVSVHTE